MTCSSIGGLDSLPYTVAATALFCQGDAKTVATINITGIVINRVAHNILSALSSSNPLIQMTLTLGSIPAGYYAGREISRRLGFQADIKFSECFGYFFLGLAASLGLQALNEIVPATR